MKSKQSNSCLQLVRRACRKLVSRHSLGNKKSKGNVLLYHYCGRKFQVKTRNGLSYTVPTNVYIWLNVSNNVITALRRCSMVKNIRIGTLQEQLSFWKGQKRRLSSLTNLANHCKYGRQNQ